MADYRSRLSTVVKERKIRQELLQRELAVQQQVLFREETTLHKMIEASETALNGLSKQQKGLGTPGEIEIYYQFVKHQAKKIRIQEESIESLTLTYETIRKKLETVTQEKKMIEKIEAQRKEAYLDALKKKESDFLDEVGARMTRGLS
ncbi:flagellar FliJ family protein [Nitrospira defluvii]|nr:flagellar FliJ family protein [Nitrospira defluvii]